MCGLISDVISCYVLSCDTGKINAYDDKVVTVIQKKYGNQNFFT